MAVALLAVREDIVRQRIPNRLNLAALVLGCSLTFLAGGFRGLVLHAAGGALVGCGVLVPFYLLRGMGAGDAKLMGALGSFLGPSGALLAAAWALVAGAVIALAIVAWRLVEPRPRLEHTSAGASSAVWRAMETVSAVRKERFPYAVAIAAGVVLTLSLQGSLRTLYTALGIG